VQSIREEEGKILLNEYADKQDKVVTGTVQRYVGKNISVNLGKVDGILVETEQIRGESFRHGDRIKVYVVEVKSGKKGPKITLSRTHPELVKRLFEMEVAEVADGIVEIVGISRDPGARTKIAVRSNEPGVDPIGACVGPNGMRVNAVVDDLGGEKIDIIQWSDDPEIYIKNALSPAKTISVTVDPEIRSARVIVPDSQFSLAIGREGQNAKLAHRLTGYKIDIKSDASYSEM
jgi:N utilization substance protein A